MNVRYFFTFFTMGFLLIGCDLMSSSSENHASEHLPLKETSWWLQAFQDETGAMSDPKQDDIVLVFADTDTLRGRVFHEMSSGEVIGGNSYTGVFSTDHSSIEVKEIVSTHAGVPAGSRYGEHNKALGNALSYEIEGDRLFIYYVDEDGRKALHFKAGEDIDLKTRF